MSLSVELRGLDAIRAKLQPKLARDPAARMVADAARFTAVEAKSGAGDGAIARSIVAEIHGLEARVRGSGAALAVEYGRHPGTPPPPVDALRAWARARGVEDFVYPIARAISRRGIKGRFFMRKAVQKLTNQELPRLASVAKKEIETEWAK